MKYKIAFVLCLTASLLIYTPVNSIAQTLHKYRYPLDIPPILSANFGELRPNHFHSGIDLKTQGVINKPVYAVEDGYVSRISVSPWGYGLALYLDHPNGQTSIYGHLEKYASKIADYVIEKQYQQEKYSINILLEKHVLPIKKGEVIASSGNTGSSFGPHVHFELRETRTQRAIDPLPYYIDKIADTQKPQIRGIAVYPLAGEGVVNQSASPLKQTITKLKNGNSSVLKTKIEAWGNIGIGIDAIDRMNNTANVYGVKKVTLHCDEEIIFSSDISSFLFEETRMINSLTDFDHWYKTKRFYMKSYIEPGNKLNIYTKVVNNGLIRIDKERDYKFKYIVEDLHNNRSQYQFTITGKKQTVPAPPLCTQAFVWDSNNYFVSDDFSLTIPKTLLFDNIGFILNKGNKNNFYSSDTYIVHDSYVPLNGRADMQIKLTTDTLQNKSQYGLISIEGTKTKWLGGKYANGSIYLQISELGNTYAVDIDKDAPVISPINPEKWITQKKISIKATDDYSGVKSYRGTIDGNFVLFEYDNKSPIYTYKFDEKRLKKGETHSLIFTVIDACENKSEYTYQFDY